MAFFSFTSTVLDEAITFIFGFRICISSGLAGFNSHLADSRKPETFAATRRSNLDEFIDNRDVLLLPDLVGVIEKMSVFDATSTRAALGLLGSDSNRSEKATQSKSLSDLEEDLDCLLKIGDEGATACRGPPVFDNYSDSNEEYLLTTSWSLEGLGDKGATTCWEALFSTTTRSQMTISNPFRAITKV
jgi:hypothetical protein